MDKNYETLKCYETIMQTLYPKKKISYVTNYTDLERLVNDRTPNIVILDGDTNYGFITAKKIKEISKKIKVFISSSNEKVALEVFQNDLNGFIKKPFTLESLKQSLKNN